VETCKFKAEGKQSIALTSVVMNRFYSGSGLQPSELKIFQTVFFNLDLEKKIFTVKQENIFAPVHGFQLMMWSRSAGSECIQVKESKFGSVADPDPDRAEVYQSGSGSYPTRQ
jgi:hypothetical protein